MLIFTKYKTKYNKNQFIIYFDYDYRLNCQGKL